MGKGRECPGAERSVIMISMEICRKVLGRALATGADYAEIFAENTTNHLISMIADKVDDVKDAVVAGAAVRVYKGLRSVMASTVDTSEGGLLACADKAAEALLITKGDWVFMAINSDYDAVRETIDGFFK